MHTVFSQIAIFWNKFNTIPSYRSTAGWMLFSRLASGTNSALSLAPQNQRVISVRESALSIRWSLVARAAFSPEQKRDIAVLIRVCFRIGRLMVYTFVRRNRPRSQSELRSGTGIMSAAKYAGSAVRATMNDTPRRRAPVVMMIPPASRKCLSIPRYKQSMGTCAVTTYVTNRRGSRSAVARERLSLPRASFALPAESGPRRNCIIQRIILLSHRACANDAARHNKVTSS